LVGDEDGYVTYYENTNSDESPTYTDQGLLQEWWKFEIEGEFSIEGPADLRTRDYEHSVPCTADIDSDGDLDLLVGYALDESASSGSKRVYFFENIPDVDGTPKLYRHLIDLFGWFTLTIGDNYISKDKGGIFGFRPGFKTKGYSMPSTYDIDSELGPDLIVGDYQGNIYVLNNTGESDIIGKPEFADCATYHPNSGNLGLVYHIAQDYEYTAPLFADLTGDGILDVIFGEEAGNVMLMEGHDPGNGLFYPDDFTDPTPLLLSAKTVVASDQKNVELFIETIILRSDTQFLSGPDVLIELSSIEEEIQSYSDGISVLVLKVSINGGEEELLSGYTATAKISNLTIQVIKRIMIVT
ncbi:MAG: hypothetical protein ACFFBD_00095, partial [Candidatus Hodarchaeota archaeon]